MKPKQPGTEKKALALVRKSLQLALRRKATIEVRWTWERISPEEGAFIVAKVTVPKALAARYGSTKEECSGKPVFFSYFAFTNAHGDLVSLLYNRAFGPQKSWKDCGKMSRFV